jgi:hypothetical protein
MLRWIVALLVIWFCVGAVATLVVLIGDLLT